MNNARSFCERLNIKYLPEIDNYFKMGLKLYEEKGLFAVDKERIIRLSDEYNIFRKWLGTVLCACDSIAGDEDLLIYIYTLISLISEGADVKILHSPDRQCLETDFAPLFGLLYFLEDMIFSMEQRKIPFEMISDTLNGFDTVITEYEKHFGRPGMRYYTQWLMLYVKCKILKIGRLMFESAVMEENIRVYVKDKDVKVLCDDEEKPLDGFRELLRKGDRVISVHIPAGGALGREECGKAYSDAEKLMPLYYPEHDFKAFVCYSWLLNKELKNITGKESNITRFADEYETFPIPSEGKDVYFFLYSLPKPAKAEKLPEHSSMHRAVKKYLSDGNIFYEYGGIKPFKSGCDK